MPGAPDDLAAALDYAAYILDIGRSVDYYNRLRHTADIVANADLDGFSHREVAVLSAIIREADRHLDLKRMSPLLGDGDAQGIAQAGVLLLLADEIIRRLAGEPRIEVRERDNVFVIVAPGFSRSGAERLESRFERAFGKVLIIA
jgi:exopolyphosphatase/pppGpp-phosphohydrolase